MPEEQIAPQQSEPNVNQGEAGSTAETTPSTSEVNASASSSPEPGDPQLLERLKALDRARPEPPKEPRSHQEIQKEFERLYSEAGKAYFAREFQKMTLDHLTNQFAEICQEAEKRKALDQEKIQAAQAKRERKAAARAAGGKNGTTSETAAANVGGKEAEPKGSEASSPADESSAEGLGEAEIP